MLGREQENAGTMLGKVTQRAERELPPLQIPKVQPMLNPDKTMAGREAQDQLRDQFVTKTGEGKDLYRTFMGQHGNTPIQTGPTSATPLRNLHAERSAALEDARAAAGSNDYKSQMEAMRRVHRISDMIDAADPALAARYNDISRQYGQIMEQFDNPVVRSLREKVPAENLVDVMLHPDKLNTFAPFRENTTVTGRSIPAHQSVSQEDAVHMVRAALGEDKFRQLRADTIMQMGQAARSSEHGTIEGLQGRELVGQLKKLPPGVQTALFGPGTSQALNDIAEVTAHTQRTRSGTGALWIVMRQPSEMLKVGGGVMGAAGLAAGSGYKTGHEDLGLTTAGAILLSPLVLSNILRSSTATKLFVRAIGSQPTVKAKILQRLATQIPAEAIREQTPYADGGNDLGNGLPNPPGQ
jgi:hypothetical protein